MCPVYLTPQFPPLLMYYIHVAHVLQLMNQRGYILLAPKALVYAKTPYLCISQFSGF